MTTRHASRWTAVFLTLEFGLTLLLLCYVGLTVRNFQALQQADGVVSTDNLLTFWLSLPPQKYRTPL